MQSRIPKREMRVDSDRNMNLLRGHNTEKVVLMTDNQNNFGDQNQKRFYQNDAGSYTHPQQPISNFSNMLLRGDKTTNVNIRTNVMAVSQTVLMTDNQNNNNNSGLHHQNRVGGYINNDICSQQHVDLNNFSSHERDINNRNTNLYHENVEDNVQNDCLLHHNRIDDIQQADLNNLTQCQIPEQETRTDHYTTTYTNLDYQDDSTRSAYSAYTQQQIDLVPVRENNNMEITQANPTTDINRNYDDNGMPCNDNRDMSIDSST